MKRFLTSLGLLPFATIFAGAVDRFPRPDFESGYQYPEYSYAVPNEMLWDIIDVSVLLILLGIVTWALFKKRTKGPILAVSIVSVGYFGFFRGGCVCSIGSIQNVALAFADPSYSLPIAVFLFFIIPIVFAFLFGRVFCAGVCPFGALQDLVNVKNYRLSRAVTEALSIIPWIYLAFALLYALTRTRFIICKFDPFIGIFRMGGDIGVIGFGILLLLMSVFTGRPFCRFLCPYGAILGLFSRVSVFKAEITPKKCISCDLCHDSCPVDAIKAPYGNKTGETPVEGVKRIVVYMAVLPVLMLAGALIMRWSSPDLARANSEVRLYEMVTAYEAAMDAEMEPEVEAFYSQGRNLGELEASKDAVLRSFRLYSTLAGILIGLVIGLKLLEMSLKRGRKEYEIDYASCVGCAKCFDYCPQNKALAKASVQNPETDR
ncbi:MAG: 4Fe-4S binding protein [Bacteroidales bacterium]|nr:4Fe-4S binding protein [Bacteroidales bacterium]